MQIQILYPDLKYEDDLTNWVNPKRKTTSKMKRNSNMKTTSKMKRTSNMKTTTTSTKC